MSEKNTVGNTPRPDGNKQPFSEYGECMRRIREKPANKNFLFGFYRYLMERKRYRQALACMGRIVMLTMPGSNVTAAYWVDIARLYMLIGKYDRVLIMAQTGIERCACTPKQRYKLEMFSVDALDMLGQHEAARYRFETAKKFARLHLVNTRNRLKRIHIQTESLPDRYAEAF